MQLTNYMLIHRIDSMDIPNLYGLIFYAKYPDKLSVIVFWSFDKIYMCQDLKSPN